ETRTRQRARKGHGNRRGAGNSWTRGGHTQDKYSNSQMLHSIYLDVDCAWNLEPGPHVRETSTQETRQEIHAAATDTNRERCSKVCRADELILQVNDWNITLATDAS